MVAKENLHTVSEYLEFIQRPENADKRYELIDGEIKEMPPSSKDNTMLASWIASFLWNYVRVNNIGRVSGPDGGYKISETNAFQPDVGFITKERIGGRKGVEFPNAPDLAVEVISPSEGPRDVVKKAQTYLQAGTKVVLAVYADERLIDIYRLNADGTVQLSTLHDNAELVFDDVMPGFKANLSEIFSVLDLD